MILIPDDQLDAFIDGCSRRMRQNNAEELYAAIGYGGMTIANCLPKLKEEWQKLKAAEAEEIKKQVTAQADRLKELEAKETELQAKIQEIMNTLRENAPAEIGGYKVTAVRDYKKDTITDTATGAVKPTGLPASNVLYYELEDDAWVCVRPSGTEPKVKFYLGVKGTSLEDADAKSKALSEAVHAMIGKML